MSDRSDVIEIFESIIISGRTLPNTLIDQILLNSTTDFSYDVEGANGLDLLEYTKGVYTGEVEDTPGTFSRTINRLEQRILALYLKKGYLERERDALAKQIGYATKNMTTKDLKSSKDAIAREISEVFNDIVRLTGFIKTPSNYNG